MLQHLVVHSLWCWLGGLITGSSWNEWMDGWPGMGPQMNCSWITIIYYMGEPFRDNAIYWHNTMWSHNGPADRQDRKNGQGAGGCSAEQGNANCLWNIKHLSNKIYFWKECLCVNMNLCSVLPLPCQDVKDKRKRQGLFANEVVAYWFPYSRNSSVNGSWAFNWKCSLVHLLFS